MDELEKKLANLEIAVFEGSDGQLTVISDSTPSFCFVRKTEEEIRAVVAQTLRSYAKVFHGADIEVFVEDQPPVPIVTLRPRNKVGARFVSQSGARGHAFA